MQKKMIKLTLLMLILFLFQNTIVFAQASDSIVNKFLDYPYEAKELFIDVLKTFIQDDTQSNEAVTETMAALIYATHEEYNNDEMLSKKIMSFVKVMRSFDKEKQDSIFYNMTKSSRDLDMEKDMQDTLNKNFPGLTKQMEELNIGDDSFIKLLNIAKIIAGQEKVLDYQFAFNKDLIALFNRLNIDTEDVFGINKENLVTLVGCFESEAETLDAKAKKELRNKMIPAEYMASLMKDITFHWARIYIEELAEKELIKGVGNNRFEPEGRVTKAQFTMMLLNALNLLNESAAANLSDVDKSDWYYTAAATAQELGIIDGLYEENKFGADEYVTRQDMAVMTYRAAKTANIELDPVRNKQTFSDEKDMAPYAVEAVEVLQQANVINGLEGNRFGPDENASRAQAAKIIYMLLEPKK